MSSKLGLRLHADEEHWIPLSDLMTGLMFLFLVVAIAYMVAVNVQYAKPKKLLISYSATRSRLYQDLNAQFGEQLTQWGGSIDPQNLSVRFAGATTLFAPGSAELQPRFKAMLDNFFPRYVRLISQSKYRDILTELRIEGYTSTGWRPGASADEAYVGNMKLSQERARAVLEYVLSLSAIQSQKLWLMQVLSADGFSSSHVVRRRDGEEDSDASQRVEFHVVTDANRPIAAALRAFYTPMPGQSVSPRREDTTPLVAGTLPPYPDWASRLIGKGLVQAFPRKSLGCWGYLDGVTERYSGPPAGVKLRGWAYDMATRTAVDRVILADIHGRIVGAAVGGFSRPDVPQTLTWVKSPTTGWEGYTQAARRPNAWAIVEKGAICPLSIAAGVPSTL